MTPSLARRGFLRGLTTLPLIGGGVTLIGQPTGVAAPVTDELRARYLGWLAREFTEALVEREQVGAERSFAHAVANGHSPDPTHVTRSVDRRRRDLAYLTEPLLVPACPPHPSQPPSTRAALVLAAVGLDPDALLRIDGRR